MREIQEVLTNNANVIRESEKMHDKLVLRLHETEDRAIRLLKEKDGHIKRLEKANKIQGDLLEELRKDIARLQQL